MHQPHIKAPERQATRPGPGGIAPLISNPILIRLAAACKVAEYQRRGVLHFHAVIRLDGPAGPATTPPAWATPALLTAAIDQAPRAVTIATPTAPAVPARTPARGREHHTRPITATGELTDTKVAAYVAKHATKAAEGTGTLDRRITPADRLAGLPVRDHARRHIAERLHLSRLPPLSGLRLAAWAHMLGFRGHFSTKSRAYSVTLGALRAERAAYQHEQAMAAGLLPELDSDTTLVINHWHFAGRGHSPPIGPLAADSTSHASSPPTGGPP